MVFKDFIPENEMEGEPIGAGGYQDFVPERKPVKREEIAIPTPEVKAKPKGRPVKAQKKGK